MENPAAPDHAPLKHCLLRQFDTSWRLAAYHLDGLDMAACLWRPAAHGLHITPATDGGWAGAWPETESYALGPSSIGWLAWHMGYWLSMAIDHNFGDGRLDSVIMPDDPREWITGLAEAWRAQVAALPEAGWQESDRSRWPFRGQPFADVVAWANIELMKSAAEIGYARFLHAADMISPSSG